MWDLGGGALLFISSAWQKKLKGETTVATIFVGTPFYSSSTISRWKIEESLTIITAGKTKEVLTIIDPPPDLTVVLRAVFTHYLPDLGSDKTWFQLNI